jgi:hypothetical protein
MSHNRSSKRRVHLARLCLLLCGLMFFLDGCASRSTRKTSSLNRTKNVEASATELSSRNQSLLALYSSEIEGAADKIILESPSPVARRQALVWKAEAIPVLQTSLLNTDPVAAAIDTWAFIFQMTAYMEQPTVKNQFGAFAPVTADTLKSMDAEMEQLVLAAAPSANVPDLRQRIGAWAAAHPIQAGLTGRRSADADLIKQADQNDLGTLASIQALQEGLGDITARLDSYNAYLPKQARWQAELLLSDLTDDPKFSAAALNLAVLSRALDKTSNTVEQMPELAGKARAVALADVEGQRLAAQAFLREERSQTLDALTQERMDAVADLRGERLAATADLRGERQIVLDALHNEEVEATNDMHAISEKTLKDFDARSRGLIDHFFWRAVELMLITLVLWSLAVWFLSRRLVPKRSANDHKTWLDPAA